MVSEAASRTFRALAHPTRRAILDTLREQELCAGSLAARFPVSRPAIARQVRILLRAGLLTERRRAQTRLYAVNPEALSSVDAWLAPYRAFWAARLTDLKRVVESRTGTDPDVDPGESSGRRLP